MHVTTCIFLLRVIDGSVPITGTSRPPGQTDRPGSSPPKPKGAVGLPRWTTKATPAATRALMIEFFVLEQKILWHSLHDPGTRYRDTTGFCASLAIRPGNRAGQRE